MAFLNRIRLPFYLSKPQYPVDEEVYLRTNGRRVVLKAIVSKEMQGKTDWMPSQIHERMVIAMKHDTVNAYNENYTASIRQSGAYEIEWPDFLNYPLAPANFKALEEAFVARNNRCDDCDELTQLSLMDDTILGVMGENWDVTYDVAANDGIACSGATFAIVSFDLVYLTGASIDSNGVISFSTKPTCPSTATVPLVQYRVTCPNGETATAWLYGAIAGSLTPTCEIPTFDSIAYNPASSNPIEATFSWLAPTTPPADGYQWELYEMDSFGFPAFISSGSVAAGVLNVTVNNMTPTNDHLFMVRGVCDLAAGDFSPWEQKNFTTPASGVDTMVINVTCDINPLGGGQWEYTPVATISSPAGVTLINPVDITGEMHLHHGSGTVVYPFTITIPAGNSTANGTTQTETEISPVSFHDLGSTPTTETGSDTIIYTLSVI